jgi:queuine tRNA-ribosyltransferase
VLEPFSFDILATHEGSSARAGRLVTPHGALETPAFIFCATKAAIKAVTPQQMQEAQTQIILANTYHLMLQPGPEVVAAMGGLHRFMGWDGPMLTDSGGFQIFSLGHGSVANEVKGKRMTDRPKTMLKISEEGALFKSYLDGQKHLLTPERSIQIQRQLGADLIVVFDECTPFHVSKDYTARSMALSHRWGLRSLAEYQRGDTTQQRLYGIIQGGVYEDLRRESADFVSQHPFFGNAVGGSLGADKVQMAEVVAMTMSHLNRSRPTHLLGIGGIGDIFQGVKQGIDTFDCVHPTRLARHGGALVRPIHAPTAREHLNLTNSFYRMDSQPIEDDCPCATCQHTSRSYLHHLLKAKELLAYTLISIHNVCFMNRLMQEIRQGIMAQSLAAVEQRWLPSAGVSSDTSV